MTSDSCAVFLLDTILYVLNGERNEKIFSRFPRRIRIIGKWQYSRQYLKNTLSKSICLLALTLKFNNDVRDYSALIDFRLTFCDK